MMCKYYFIKKTRFEFIIDNNRIMYLGNFKF